VVTSTESPGEILRRQARDLIEEIPAAEMPTAIVFLEFLRERGAMSLLGNGAPATPTADKTSEELPRQDELDELDELRKQGAVG
jgi:hypothetical protein